MDKGDSRFALKADKYLDKHQVLVYMEDAVSQLLEHKDDNPKVNVTKFLCDYFKSVRDGNHTLFREYSFVRKTRHNRASFVYTFWKCFRNIGRKGDVLSVREYHSLLCLMCSDFPFGPVQRTSKIILMDDAVDCLISFSDFLFAFQLQFCFEEFLGRCDAVFKELQETRPSAQDPVVVPTSAEEDPTPAPPPAPPTAAPGGGGAKEGRPDGVDSMQFFRSLVPVCEELDMLAPPVSVLKEILNGAERVTYYGFLMELAKSDSLNASIGKLPKKADLLDITDSEIASMQSSRITPKPKTAGAGKAKGAGKKPITPGRHGAEVGGANTQEHAGAQAERSVLSSLPAHTPRPVTSGLATTPQATHHNTEGAGSGGGGGGKLTAVRRRLARSEARSQRQSSSDSGDTDSDD